MSKVAWARKLHLNKRAKEQFDLTPVCGKPQICEKWKIPLVFVTTFYAFGLCEVSRAVKRITIAAEPMPTALEVVHSFP